MSLPFKFGCNAIPSRLALSGPSARLRSNHSPVLATTNAMNACPHRDKTDVYRDDIRTCRQIRQAHTQIKTSRNRKETE